MNGCLSVKQGRVSAAYLLDLPGAYPYTALEKTEAYLKKRQSPVRYPDLYAPANGHSHSIGADVSAYRKEQAAKKKASSKTI